MCRGFQPKERREPLIKIKSFYVHLSFSSNSLHNKPIYDSLTLHFLPRINGGPLEIDGLNLRPDTPGFITLHRVVSAETLYGSRERVAVSEGTRFEIYGSDAKMLKGVFRRDEVGEKYKLDCACQLESGDHHDEFLREAEVCVEMEGYADRGVLIMSEKVEMVARKARRRRRCFEGWLEEIPEEREVERESEWDDCCCCCGCSDIIDDHRESAGGDDWWCEGGEEMEDGGGRLRWGVDVGIWVVCLGVGYFVSKASFTRMITRTQRGLF